MADSKRSAAAKKAAQTRKRRAAGKKAAETKRRRAAGKKAAETKKRRAAGKKAAETKKRRAAGKKAAETRKRRAAEKNEQAPEAPEKPLPISNNARLKALIEAGESRHIEFKSTFRWNTHAARFDEVITHACLKTIAAFLNTGGGTLLIGVADDGEIAGIELDKFPNPDRFMLHLIDRVKSSLGAAASALVSPEIIEIDGKSVCLVSCDQSQNAVFLKPKTGEEQFFVRTGPATTQMPIQEALKYIKERFE